MSDPFEDDSRAYLALHNDEGQYSLWPQDIDVPAGWSVQFGPAAREEVLDHIERCWTDMRPERLRAESAATDGMPV